MMTEVFGHSVRSESLVLHLVESLVCFVVAYCLLFTYFPVASSGVSARAAALAAVLALATGTVSGAMGSYAPETWLQARRLLFGTFFTVLLLLPFTWIVVAALVLAHPLTPNQHGPVALLLAVAGAGTALIIRTSFWAIARAGVFRKRVALLGTVPSAIKDCAQYRIVLRAHDDFVLHAFNDRELRAERIDIVVVPDISALPPIFGAQLQAAKIRLMESCSFLEGYHQRVHLADLRADWLRTSGGARHRSLEAGVRRAFDIVASLGLLVLTLPITLLAMLAIRLEGPGPIFYRQERVGQNGRVFDLIKLRSMRVDAEANGAPQWARRRDTRVTRVGRILRLLRVDEIPQVLNVLKGEMAFIGPRPERPIFVEQLATVIPHYRDRLVVKPGITGWAQVNYPYGASVEDARQKLAYDFYYIRRRTLFLDLLILLSTVRVILLQEGAR